MKNKSPFVLLGLMLVQTLAFATSFPSGGWDISATDETGWNGPIPISRAEGGSAVFDSAYPVDLRATADVTFWRMCFKTAAKGTVFDLSRDGDHRVTLTESDASNLFYGFQFDCNSSRFTFRGGVWDFNSKLNLAAGYQRHSNTLVFDQAVLTNVAKVSISYSEDGNNNYGHTLILTNSSLLHVTGDFFLGEYGGFDNSVEINAGCKVQTKRVYSENIAQNGTVRENCNMRMLVRGEGSQLSATDVHWGQTSAGNRLALEDGANLSCSKLYVGYNASSSNNVMAVGGGSRFALSSDDCYVGYSGGNNTLILDGMGSSAYVHALTVGKASDGNVFRMSGGSTIESQNGIVFTAGAPASGQTPATKDNRVEILDGSAMSCYRVIAQGDNSGFVVSNATLNIANGYEHGILLGAVSGTTNNYLRLEGSSPIVRTSWDVNGINMGNGARLEFVLPETPYAEMPIRVHKILADSSCAIKFDTSAIDGTEHGTLRYHLARVWNAEKTASLDASVIEAANAELAPKGGHLAWDKYDLFVTFKSNRGMSLIVR